MLHYFLVILVYAGFIGIVYAHRNKIRAVWAVG